MLDATRAIDALEIKEQLARLHAGFYSISIPEMGKIYNKEVTDLRALLNSILDTRTQSEKKRDIDESANLFWEKAKAGVAH